MKNWNRTTRLTLFSTAAITAVMFILQLFILDIRPNAPYVAFFALPVTALLAYVVSAVVIDKAMNPIRLMIEKIREIGNMNFTKPLVVYDESEDIREYAAAFNQMAHRLGGYIERQKRFISDASHELATPITVINGHADLLLRRAHDNPHLLEASLATIKSEAVRMNDLVDSLLMLARSDSGKEIYHFAPVDMTRLLEEGMAEARLIAPDFSFEAAIAPNLSAICDENAIRRVVRILLSNAVKYAKDTNPADNNLLPTGRVSVSAEAAHGTVKVTVRDNGIGIPPAYLPHIFERFYRVDPARTHKPGSAGSSGLGLAIAREIITAHGGEIHAESEPGEGTAIVFSTP
ncbi:MAG: HAMP domain-containing histidine kinase [Defluviitaleaceae bacterium]|nr:HAMP domain-containing histidine kinase [Defluviitaleaceae bacterium]MCL2239290.1 HAMP domain-containing histidine kinase [Defluviitaleaceae bacterium]